MRICGCRGRCNGFPQLITPDNRTNRNALRPIAVATAEPADEAAIAATEAPVPTAGETREDVEIADRKAQIARAEMDLDIRTQEFALDQDMVYSNPNYTDLRVGMAKLDAEQRRINERQLEIEELKVRLSLLQERLAQRKHASKSPPRP